VSVGPELEGEAAGLMRRLADRLAASYPEWGVADLSTAGGGLSCLVYRASTDAFGEVALRVPRRRVSLNPNDGAVVARTQLTREAAIARHLHGRGLPLPAVHVLHLGDDGFDFLVSEYVPHDHSQPDSRALGRIVAGIHRQPLADAAALGLADRPLSELLTERLVRRADALRTRTGGPLPLPPADELAARLRSRDDRRALLHMDVRPANVLTVGGEVRALIDWGNALAGDPALELARVAEYGHLDDAFRVGYAERGGGGPAPEEVDALYRLDTAVMLALVFLAEAPNPALAPAAVDRASALAGAVARG
jgi:aminoglycoside phosphotransferase (APT) family kinase protein